MESNFRSGGDKLEFRQIVLGLIKNILNLSLRSNKGGEKLTLYFNSIEALGDVLIPFYDAKMNKAMGEFEKALAKIQKESSEQRKKLCLSEYSSRCANTYRAMKKNAYRTLFRELNMLLKRNDYLKSSVYGEDKDELATEDEDEDPTKLSESGSKTNGKESS